MPVRTADNPTRVPVTEDFLDVEEAGDPAISPDGELVAVAVTNPARRAHATVWLARADGTGEPRAVLNDIAVASPLCWSPQGTQVAVVVKAASGLSVSCVDAARGWVRRHTVPSAATGAAKLAWLPGTERLLCLLQVPGDPADGADSIGQLWSLDTSTPAGSAPAGSAEEVTALDLDVADFAPAPDGTAIAVVLAPAESGGRSALCVVDPSSGAVARTLCDRAQAPTSRDQTLSWSPDGTRVLFSFGDQASGHWPAIVAADGSEPHHLLREREGTVLRAVWTGPDRIVAQVFERTASVLVDVDLTAGSTRTLCDVRSGYPRFSVAGRRTAFVTSDEAAAPDVWIRDAGGATRQLTALNPQLRELRLGPVREVSWVSSGDGTRVYGLLVLPPDHTGGPLPTIVNVHGGPHYHWCAGWLGSWLEWAQPLAARGYAVLLPNPRGSTGRGWPFAHAIRGDVGTLPLRDVLDGVDSLIDSRIADEHRLGIGGWSYGGFLTAWAITQTDRFKAAVVGAGIADFYSFIGSSVMGRVWRAFLPDAEYPHRPGFDQASPMSYLSRCVTPTLVVHGEQDRKISVDQGRMLHRGLRDLDVPTELVVLPGEGHTLAGVQARRRALDAVLGWFDRHLSPA